MQSSTMRASGRSRARKAMRRSIIISLICLLAIGGLAQDARDMLQKLQPVFEPSCVIFCFSPTSCPTELEIHARMRSEKEQCEACIRLNCSSDASLNETEYFICQVNARASCKVCHGIISEKDHERIRNCMKCMEQCRTTTKPLWVPQPQPLQHQLHNCSSSCVSSRRCASPTVVHEMLMVSSSGCKQCLESKCGELSETNHLDDLAICVRDEQPICENCPPLSAEESQKRINCKSCRTECLQK